MTTEIRRIIFSHSESTAAIRKYGEKNNITFPQGKIIRARFAGSAEYEVHNDLKSYKSSAHGEYNIKESRRAITLTFFDDISLEQKYYNLTDDFVSSAIIEYCIANKIMLPRQAEKRLDLTELNICLDINMDTPTPDDKGNARLELAD